MNEAPVDFITGTTIQLKDVTERMEVYNNLGQLSKTLFNMQSVDCSAWNSGIYFIKSFNQGKTSVMILNR